MHKHLIYSFSYTTTKVRHIKYKCKIVFNTKHKKGEDRIKNLISDCYMQWCDALVVVIATRTQPPGGAMFTTP